MFVFFELHFPNNFKFIEVFFSTVKYFMNYVKPVKFEPVQ